MDYFTNYKLKDKRVIKVENELKLDMTVYIQDKNTKSFSLLPNGIYETDEYKFLVENSQIVGIKKI